MSDSEVIKYFNKNQFLKLNRAGQFYLIPAMFFPFIASIFYFSIFEGGAVAQGIYLAAKIFIFVYPLFFISKTDSFKNAFRFKEKEFLLGFTVGVAIFAVGYALIQVPWLWQEIQRATPFVKAKIDGFGVAEHYLLMAIVISFLHSMLEEYYWRWFVFGASKSNIASAVAFSLHHFIVLDFYFPVFVALILTAMVAIGGIMFNFLYSRKKNVWGAWSAHVLVDLFIFYVGYVLLQ